MLSHMLRLAVRHEDGPVALRYPRGRGKGEEAIERLAPEMGQPPGWGKGRLLRQGGRVLIVAAGPLVYEGLSAAGALEKEGCPAAVFDPCFLKPLDTEGIWDAAKQTALTVIVEENAAPGGLGWTVTRLLADSGYQGKIRCICIPDDFIPQGDQQELRKNLGLDAEGIARAVWDELK